jgi:Domain of Unknown Function with PDB structure (DUF3857)/Transglutaminase-like superfamily
MNAWSLAWVAVLFVVAPISAEERWPVKRGPSPEPLPYRYQPGDLHQIPSEFLERDDGCIVYLADVRLIQVRPGEPGALGDWVHHRVIRCNRPAAFFQVGEFRDIRFDPDVESLTLNEAAVHKPDGSVLEVRPDQVRVRDVNTDFLKYRDTKMVIVSLSGLEAGDVIDVKWTVRRFRLTYEPGRLGGEVAFGRLSDPQEDDAPRDHYPVARQVVQLRLPRLPADPGLRFAVANGAAKYTAEEQGPDRLHTWEASNYLPPATPGPAGEEQRLTLHYSTSPSWDAFAPHLKNLLEDCWEGTPEIDRLVEEQTQGRATPEEKARALAEWVRDNVRYLSANHVYGPHPPARTLADRCGDCKDKCQLLAVMLRAAGIPVGQAFLSTWGRGQIPEDVPYFWGNHVILLVTIDGREHWVDPAAQRWDWDTLPPSDADRVCYVFDGERVSLRRTPRGAPTPAETPLPFWQKSGSGHFTPLVQTAPGAEPPLPIWLPLVLAGLPLLLLLSVALAREQTKEDRATLGGMAFVLALFVVAVLWGAFPENARQLAGVAAQSVADFVSRLGMGAACLGAVLVGLMLFGLTPPALPKTALWKRAAALMVLAAWWIGIAVLAWLYLGGVGKDRIVQIFVGLGSALGGVLLLLLSGLTLIIGALPAKRHAP